MASTPSTPVAGPCDEVPAISSDSSMPSMRKFTEAELMERALKSIAYTQARLNDGDTLVRIGYPDDCSKLYDPVGGFTFDTNNCRVNSHRLLATGSRIFKQLLEDEIKQKRMRRSMGFVNRGSLPGGISFVLDFSLPSEGDEVVDLVSRLSCPSGFQYWYTAESRLGVPSSMVGGMDPVAKKPSDPRDASEMELMGMPGRTVQPDPRSVNKKGEIADEYADVAESSKVLHFEDDLTKALRISREEAKAYAAARNLTVEPAVDYSKMRHLSGIELLLQIIEGKTPILDSAPKVWTLFALSECFDCTEVVRDLITSWMITFPNCQIIEILPEISYKIGNELQSISVARSAFAILVSEEALNISAAPENKVDSDKIRTTKLLRIKDEIDERSLSAIQAAGSAFQSRVRKSFDDLVRLGGWITDIPEYSKLLRFLARYEEDDPEASTILELSQSLEHFIRGHILSCLTKELPFEFCTEADKHRRAEAYLNHFDGSFSTIYNSFSANERMLTRQLWQLIRDIPWVNPNQPLTTNVGDENTLVGEVKVYDAGRFEVEKVTMAKIKLLRDRVNTAILGKPKDNCHGSIKAPSADVEKTETIEETIERFNTKYQDPDKISDFFDVYAENQKPISETSSNLNSNSGKVFVTPITVHPPKPYSGEGKPLPFRIRANEVNFVSHSPEMLDLYDQRWETGEEAPKFALKRTDYPQIPREENLGGHSPFSLDEFICQASKYVWDTAYKMLQTGEVDRTLTDTLLCLDENEYKFLPLWAGGNEDGTGGVFTADMPPAQLGPNGPGPAYHTGFSSTSRASTEVGWDGTSTVDTSIAVENGFSDHIHRRVVQSDDEFDTSSVGFSTDTEDYGDGDYKGKGKVVDTPAGSRTPTPTPTTPIFQATKNESFDNDDFMIDSDEEEDFGLYDDDEDGEDDEDNEDYEE